MEALAEALFYLCIALDPRCVATGANYRQCERTDTRVIQFSSKYLDWTRVCPDHEARVQPELKQIRRGK